MIHCCKEMDKDVTELMLSDCMNYSIVYNQRWRIYSITYTHDRDWPASRDIHYCPWCGKKLPKQLNDEWFEILEKEYGLEDPSDEDKNRVPQEFRTDEWWKKRGL